jgi:hypothetical protein
MSTCLQLWFLLVKNVLKIPRCCFKSTWHETNFEGNFVFSNMKGFSETYYDYICMAKRYQREVIIIRISKDRQYNGQNILQ